MKTKVVILVFISISFLTNCAPLVHHSDPFYNEDGNDFPRNHIPLIKPIQATREKSFSPWYLGLGDTLWIQIPNSNNAYYAYDLVDELEKFAVKNGAVMAYSRYVDKQADVYIQ